MPRIEAPRKLEPGDEVRVLALSESLAEVSKNEQQASKNFLEQQGLKVSFAPHSHQKSLTTRQKISDLHQAARDKKVRAIIAAAGGYNVNEILDHIDYGLLRGSGKIFIGYSDLTTFLNAVTTRSGLITYYGPNFGSIGSQYGGDFTRKYLLKILMQRKHINLDEQSETIYDKDYSGTKLVVKKYKNKGWWVLNGGKHIGQGRLVGGHLGSFQLLNGTPYAPKLKNKVIFIESDFTDDLVNFRRQFYSLAQHKEFSKIEGLLIGRFQRKSNIKRKDLEAIVGDIDYLKQIPVIANLDFGHTSPKFTLPIGGEATIRLTNKEQTLLINDH